MLVVFEVLAFLIGAVVIITTLIAVGAPVAQMLATKTKYKYDALGSEAETLLKKRVSDLEEEVRQLRTQLLEVKDATDFTSRMLQETRESGPARITTKESEEEKS
jgi:outer membrane murein-binding lipoprotein Lpp